jgi:hypothetical protein
MHAHRINDRTRIGIRRVCAFMGLELDRACKAGSGPVGAEIHCETVGAGRPSKCLCPTQGV